MSSADNKKEGIVNTKVLVEAIGENKDEEITTHIVTPVPTPTPTPEITPTIKSIAAVSDKTEISSDDTSSSSPAISGGGRVIVIDPGHADHADLSTEPIAPNSSVMKIKDGGGAEGVSTGTPEYEVNMRVAVSLKNILQQNGYTVIMTKTSNSESPGNVDRAKIGNNANASLVIRIHADTSDDSSVKGASMLVPSAINDNTQKIYSESKRCGQIVLNTLANEVGMKNRGVVETDQMTGFNWSTVPVILVEMGFLSNPDEDRLLSSSDYENKLAKGLADGIMEAEK
ncbi:MAG: N-acetylmuramoyl-L-alanine amidase [Bacillota bacterium]|nr:N-acetylmuramoyl-L-alanine amidase [Bacillota bacterium]